MEKIKNLPKVKKLVKELAHEDMLTSHCGGETTEKGKEIEKELQRRGVMDDKGAYLNDLPDSFWTWIDKLY